MSILKLKLKTKAGNNVDKKETFTCVFASNKKESLINGVPPSLFSFKIVYNGGLYDTGEVYQLKDHNHSGLEASLKIMLNCLHVISRISEKENITPDRVMLISADFNLGLDQSQYAAQLALSGDAACLKTLDTHGFAAPDEIEFLKEFKKINPNTQFLVISCAPKVGKNGSIIQSYERSMSIYNALRKRIVDKVQEVSEKEKSK